MPLKQLTYEPSISKSANNIELEVQNFNYSGGWLNSDGRCGKEIRCFI